MAAVCWHLLFNLYKLSCANSYLSRSLFYYTEMLPHYSELHFADGKDFLEKVQSLFGGFFLRFRFTGNQSRLLKAIHLNKMRRLHPGKP